MYKLSRIQRFHAYFMRCCFSALARLETRV